MSNEAYDYESGKPYTREVDFRVGGYIRMIFGSPEAGNFFGHLEGCVSLLRLTGPSQRFREALDIVLPVYERYYRALRPDPEHEFDGFTDWDGVPHPDDLVAVFGEIHDSVQGSEEWLAHSGLVLDHDTEKVVLKTGKRGAPKNLLTYLVGSAWEKIQRRYAEDFDEDPWRQESVRQMIARMIGGKVPEEWLDPEDHHGKIANALRNYTEHPDKYRIDDLMKLYEED